MRKVIMILAESRINLNSYWKRQSLNMSIFLSSWVLAFTWYWYFFYNWNGYVQIRPSDIMEVGARVHVPVSVAESKISKRFDVIPSGTLNPNADEIEYLQRLMKYKVCLLIKNCYLYLLSKWWMNLWLQCLIWVSCKCTMMDCYALMQSTVTPPPPPFRKERKNGCYVCSIQFC